MYWDISWKKPVLLNDHGIVLAVDNGEEVISLKEENLTLSAYKKKCEEFMENLKKELDTKGFEDL